IETEIPNGSGVRPTLIGLELRNALHGADLRRTGDRARRKTRTERVERIELRLELSLHDRREVHDVREPVNTHEFLHLHGAGARHAADVVAREVAEHDVLRALLLGRPKLRYVRRVPVFVLAALPRARD